MSSPKDVAPLAITLVTRGEPQVHQVIKSICQQTLRPSEVVIANSSGTLVGTPSDCDLNMLEIAIPQRMGLLAARYESFRRTRAEWTLLLDSTRILHKDCLATLMSRYCRLHMTAIAEGVIGDSIWARGEAVDKKGIARLDTAGRLAAGNRGYLLPRLFNSTLLMSAFEDLRQALPTSIFDHIRHGDHHLIYLAASRYDERLAATREILIDHFGDASLAQVVKKYYGYGVSQQYLRKAIGLFVTENTTARLRLPPPRSSLSDALTFSLLQSVRALAFGVGYIGGLMAEKGELIGARSIENLRMPPT